MPLFRQRERGNKRYLTGGTTASLAIIFLAAPVGIIHQDVPFEEVMVVPVFHNLLQLMLHAQGGIGGNAETAS